MLKQLSLKYFRQHIDRTFNFTPGMNTIRGDNEVGKTTTLEAWAYLCFGARALRESLADVVTYHQPESWLRVEGVIEHLGVEYTCYRAKSGAEVTFGGERITGQNEVTSFFERLFGADAKLAGKLMVASQKALAESLTGGPTEAGRMIENLANFSVIDDVVEKLQATLVTGNTSGAEARVVALQAQVDDAPAQPDMVGLEQDAADADTAAVLREHEMINLRHKLNELDTDLAKSILADEKRLQDAIATTTFETAALSEKLAREAVLAPVEGEIEALRAAVATEKDHYKIIGLLYKINDAKIEPGQWDKDLESLEAELVTAKAAAEKALADAGLARAAYDSAKVFRSEGVTERSQAAAKQQTSINLDIVRLEGRLIKEESCAFCGKDLKDIPEVALINNPLTAQIAKLREESASSSAAAMAEMDAFALSCDKALSAAVEALDHTNAVSAAASGYVTDLQAVITANHKAEQVFAPAADYITVDRSVVPGVWTWTGPEAGVAPDSMPALAALEARAKAAVVDAAMRAEWQTTRDALVVKRDGLILQRSELQVVDAAETLQEMQQLEEAIEDQQIVVHQASEARRAAEQALANAKMMVEFAQKQHQKNVADLKTAMADLATMQSNNALIKKIRAARPVITDKLWSIVLAGVSKYFSEARGEASSITRSDSMFKCNGHPVSGLSGSAQDMLGLAIRIALTKTFLATSDFLLLDEPAAACSDQRESRMLGMLASLGFGQTIMVTHSALADAFSDNIIAI
jgi:hypothetical protein